MLIALSSLSAHRGPVFSLDGGREPLRQAALAQGMAVLTQAGWTNQSPYLLPSPTKNTPSTIRKSPQNFTRVSGSLKKMRDQTSVKI